MILLPGNADHKAVRHAGLGTFKRCLSLGLAAAYRHRVSASGDISSAEKCFWQIPWSFAHNARMRSIIRSRSISIIASVLEPDDAQVAIA